MVASTLASPFINEKSIPNSISVVRSGLIFEFPLVEEATRPFMPPILEEDMVVYFAFDWGILPVCPKAPRSLRLSNTANSPSW